MRALLPNPISAERLRRGLDLKNNRR